MVDCEKCMVDWTFGVKIITPDGYDTEQEVTVTVSQDEYQVLECARSMNVRLDLSAELEAVYTEALEKAYDDASERILKTKSEDFWNECIVSISW